MKDFLIVLLIIVFAIGSMALIAFLGYQLSYQTLSIGAIVLSAIGILLFIRFGPGRKKP